MKFVNKLLPEIYFIATRSRGPGGQNVNKRESAALLRWSFLDSEIFTDIQKNLIQERLSNWLNSDNVFCIRSDEFRDLEQNKRRCLEKLDQMLEKAFYIQKKRKKTKPTHSSRLQRLQKKKYHSETKKQRKKVDY